MMKQIFKTLLLFLFCSTVYASQINQIVILGDSLSDNGNLYNYLKIVPKSPPYFQGRFTNGPTWAEHVGNYFYSKNYVDVENYAVGGATSIIHSPVNDTFIGPATLTGELYDYSARSLFTDKSNVLYIIWIGANDYLYERDPDMNGIATNVVNNIVWAVNNLINQGGRHFVIMNLPDLSRTPYAKDDNVMDRLHAISVIHNQKLADAVKMLQSKNPTSKIQFIDVFSIFNDLLNNTEQYNQRYHTNITNITEACWKGGMMLKNLSKEDQINAVDSDLKKALQGNKITLTKNFSTLAMAKAIINSPSLAEAYNTGKLYEQGVTPCTNADEHLFWDHIHPTEPVHQILANIVEQDLEIFFQ